MQIYRFWREDLRLAVSLGVRSMGYGMPSYKANPASATFDRSWIDRVIVREVSPLVVQPIVDLMHHGFPLC